MLNSRLSDGKKSGSTLYTMAKYEYFNLLLKAIWSGGVNSGVILRKPDMYLLLGPFDSKKVDTTVRFSKALSEIPTSSGCDKRIAALRE